MKINLVLLSSFLGIKKNRKKYLRIINTGLFLSIFAISSAIITFYTETEIDKTEFEIINVMESKKEFEDLSTLFVDIKGLIYKFVSTENNLNDLHEHLAATKVGEKVITIEDIYLPILYLDFEGADKQFIDDFYGEENWIDELAIYAEYFYGKDSGYLKELNKVKKQLNEFKDFFSKDYKKYHEIVFQYDTEKLLKDNLNKTINYYNDPIYRDYVKLLDFYYIFETLFNVLETFMDDVSLEEDESLKELNNKIKRLSKRETNLIITAFIFQLFIFLIIQYFEVASIEQDIKRNAKRKIK